MKFLFDLLPVLLFFAVFKGFEANKTQASQLLEGLFSTMGITAAFPPEQAPILLATVAVIIATALQIVWVKYRHGKVDMMLWVSLVLVVTLGGLTLALRDEAFIKWKPTALYWLFAAALIISPLLFKRNLIRSAMAKQINLPEPLWQKLNLAWAGFFAIMGVLNLWVAFRYSTDTWVSFKLFGGMGLMLAFVIAQSLWLARHLPKESSIP